MMIKLKIFFGMGLMVAIVMLCVFAPLKMTDRFVLPDGCCRVCVKLSNPVCYACTNENGKVCECR